MDPIYCLRDASGVVRYVGVTHDFPEQRLWEHLSEARLSKAQNHRLNWLRSLAAPPTIEVIEWVLPGNRVEREKYWISLFRDYGYRLVNGTDGGEGTLGHRHSSETRARIGAANSGNKRSVTHCTAISAAQIGNKYNVGKKATAETRARMSAARLGKKRSLETCAKISAAQVGKKRSLKAIENMRQARWGIKNAI